MDLAQLQAFVDATQAKAVEAYISDLDEDGQVDFKGKARRCRGKRKQRAIALYNSYGFGFALGMSFRDARGRRQMLWPEDLDEILRNGRTKHGCRIASR